MKFPQYTVLLTCCFLLVACGGGGSSEPQSNSTPTPVPMDTPMVGGYSATSTTSPEVQQAAQFAAQSLGSSLVKITQAEQQVVAGMNYRMQLILVNGTKYQVVVYRDLMQNMTLISSNLVKMATPSCPLGERWSPMKNNCLVPLRKSPDQKTQCFGDELYFDMDTNVCKKLFAPI